MTSPARRLARGGPYPTSSSTAPGCLSYLPGGDWPARVDLLLDGAPSDAVVVPAELGALETARLHPLFVKAEVSLVELARWEHQQPKLPWELPQRDFALHDTEMSS